VRCWQDVRRWQDRGSVATTPTSLRQNCSEQSLCTQDARPSQTPVPAQRNRANQQASSPLPARRESVIKYTGKRSCLRGCGCRVGGRRVVGRRAGPFPAPSRRSYNDGRRTCTLLGVKLDSRNVISSDGLRGQVMQVLAEYWGARAQAARPAHTAAMCARAMQKREKKKNPQFTAAVIGTNGLVISQISGKLSFRRRTLKASPNLQPRFTTRLSKVEWYYFFEICEKFFARISLWG